MNMLSTKNQNLALLDRKKQEKIFLCLKDKQKSHKRYYSLLLSNDNTDESITKTKPQLTGDKEWANSVYVYNKSVVKPLVAADIITEKLVKSYFNLDTPHVFSADEVIRRTHTRNVAKRFSLNKTLPSKTEIKHFNDKGIMTVFLYNRNSKVTEYKIKKEFPLVYKPKERIKNKKRDLTSLEKSKKNRRTLIPGKKKNLYLRTIKARVKRMWKTSLLKKKSKKLFRFGRKMRLLRKKSKKLFRFGKKARLITYFNYSQLKLYKLNSLLSTNNKKKQNEKTKFFSLASANCNNKNKNYRPHQTKQNNHFKPYSYREETYEKYYMLKKVLLLDSAQKTRFFSVIPIKPGDSANNKYKNLIKEIARNKFLVILYMLKIISFETIIKLFYLIQKIYKSRKLSIGRKNDIVRLIKYNVIKKYNAYNLLAYFKTQDINNNENVISYSDELDIIEKHRKIEINSLYRKKQLYLYYTQKLIFNNNKLKNWFMLGVKSLLSKIYNKKIELNIVNLKYLYLNSDNLAQAISTKLMNRKNRLLKVLNKTIRVLPSRRVYPYQHKRLTAKNNVDNFVLSRIEHRDVKGVRIEASGRLTKRITASKSVFKIKYKGGLRYPEAISHLRWGNKKAFPAAVVGHRKANVQYSNAKSKTIIGSFGLKLFVSSLNSSPC